MSPTILGLSGPGFLNQVLTLCSIDTTASTHLKALRSRLGTIRALLDHLSLSLSLSGPPSYLPGCQPNQGPKTPLQEHVKRTLIYDGGRTSNIRMPFKSPKA